MNNYFGDIQSRVLAEVVNEFSKRISELEYQLEMSNRLVIKQSNNLEDLQSNHDLAACDCCNWVDSGESEMSYCSDCGCLLCEDCIAYRCSECDTILCHDCSSDKANNDC